jgi:hypothetical protein
MRSRSLAVALAIYLSFALLACSKTPSSDSTNNPNASDNTSGTTTSTEKEKAAKSEKAKPEATPAVVPAGTVITVRLGESVGSKISQAGQSFSATVANPVDLGGKVVIPDGATATGTVVDAKPLGRFKGGAALELRLTSIHINGTDRPVETSALTRTAKGKGKRTAVMAGGGAGLGALIGGLAGGGKGAAIGALAGGGAGTAGAAFTGNKDIVLPAESALSFKLEQPLEVR